MSSSARGLSAAPQARKGEERLTKIVGDKVQSLGVIDDLVVQASQVESVQNEVFVHFAKVLVALGG